MGWRLGVSPDFEKTEGKKVRILSDGRLSHIAIIMDGNGRWANKRGLPREVGHKYGANAFRKIVEYCADIGLHALTVYAFSTENWKRPEKEVNSILALLRQYVDECEKNINKYPAYFHFIGDLSVFDESLRARIENIEEQTKDRPLTLNIAFNYGGRSEIARAFSRLAERGAREITQEDISAELYTASCGDPDLIIRTGGDMRISNFLLWQAAYAELYFTDVLWPDFDEKELDKAIEDFYSRKRRFGGV
ncbi:MAG: di-trans,poly-cis-decaprenylcistransferase [Clostridia bacterium]|nr:di-trans,poly-cis-decaprenylcistransferase [Clostridia bacterium]